MILIVESGSTKADWVLLEGGVSKISFQTKGWNPLFLEAEEMKIRLRSYKELQSVFSRIEQLYFYAPGCSYIESKEVLKSLLELMFVNAKVVVQSDLLAAARAVYKNKPLFVSILGTGSNTAFYDGELLEQFTPSLGYILGDEGSGVSLGRTLLRAYLYQNLPADLYTEFSKKYSISKELVLKSVYKQEHPNRFLASYVPFLVEHKKHPFVVELVRKEFECYLNTHILSNPVCSDFALAFVGSVAFYFQDVMREICKQNNLSIAEIVQSPIDGLRTYHSLKS